MKNIFLSLVAFFLLSATLQKTIEKDKLIGMWKLEKHTYTVLEAVNGKEKIVEHTCDFHLHYPILQLSKENTYSIKLKGKVIEMGSWNFQAPDTISFVNRKEMPNDPLLVLDDRKVAVTKVSSSELRIMEHQCSERTAGESVFGKVQ